ncbi:hypothetical protein [Aureibacillus halotolerans]|uniref:Uncharacterized protein n=1 Tax=Aureibacillus halotolerans TaxID=1508390 RepID=A0A4R6TPF1_9BACI|nr:hypothetical protein [Aureibacillus halotolerans]TDQ33746.1 hypothetical protein EV213_12912 [Aureibacillus halotolerans]
MYSGRDFSELFMISKRQWSDEELRYSHTACQQMLPYLNVEGLSLYKQLIKEQLERER